MYTEGTQSQTAVHGCAQRCYGENEHSVVTARMVLSPGANSNVTALTGTAVVVTMQRKRCAQSSVMAMATDSAVTALSVATTFTVMFTSLSH